jgi:hypothetical protein
MLTAGGASLICDIIAILQTTGRNPEKGPGFTDLGPEKWLNPT